MSEKVILPKEVCEALDYCIKEKYADYEILAYAKDAQFVNKLEILNEQNLSQLMRALVLGYEPQLTQEEMIKELYQHEYLAYNTLPTTAHRFAIKDTLRILGIKYDWLDGGTE